MCEIIYWRTSRNTCFQQPPATGLILTIFLSTHTILAHAALIPHTIQKYKPKPGDLICANRGKSTPTNVIKAYI